MIGGSDLSSAILWITSIIGWCKSSAGAIRSVWENTRIVLRLCGGSLNPVSRLLLPAHHTERSKTGRASQLRACLLLSSLMLTVPDVPWVSGQPARQSRGRTESFEDQLAQLAHGLRDEEPAAYARLSEFAAQNASSELGARADLALGYYDYTKSRHVQAQLWLEKAQRDTLLRQYAIFRLAQVNRALHRNGEALSQLEASRREFPDSVLTEQVVFSLADTAVAVGKPERALAALDAYSKVTLKPGLLLLRAQARERAGKLTASANDYLAVYYGFPASDEAQLAGKQLTALSRRLGAEFPRPTPAQMEARAASFYDAHSWKEARAEYRKLVPRLAGSGARVARERVELRRAQISVQLNSSPRVLASLKLTDPGLDAERLFALSQAYRGRKQESQMLESIERLVERYPRSRWAEEGLFAAGNYFWVNLDRQRASEFYARAMAQFPDGKNAQAEHWRQTWVAYLDRRAEAVPMLEQHLRRFPNSPYTANAVYWLGRASERAGNPAHARSFYLKDEERFPQTYFGRRSIERLRAIGREPVNQAEFLSQILAPPPLPSLEEAIPAAALERWKRAQALRSIGLDASAELELRAAYSTTGTSRLLWEVAQAAEDAGRYGAAFAALRQAFPQLDARRFDEVPVAVWQTAYPLPYEASLRRAADRNHVDPMLAAGLIRQESVFQPDAISHKGAVGLMQVLPKTGKKLARRLKLRYARVKLFNPEYNLQLGTLYLADLIAEFGSTEDVLAAYNAGEDRVALWRAERRYEEPAEFVESIPFSETREYVQIVMRNAELYRLLSGQASRPQQGSER